MTAVPAGGRVRPSFGTRLAAVEGLPILAVFLVILAVLMMVAPNAFLGYRTYLSILANYQPQIICALGLTLVIAAGEIDLSFPSIITLSSIVFAAFYRFDLVPWIPGILSVVPGLGWIAEPMEPETLAATQAALAWLGFVVAIAAGALCGWIAGFIVARIGIPSIIATLALSFVWRGLAVFLADGRQYALRGFNETLLWDITTGRVLTGLFDTGVVLRKPDGIPIQFLVGIVLAVVLWFVLNRHRFGEAILFVGDNANVARVIGFDVARTKIRLFTLMGALAGLSGVFLTSEIENFTTTQGQSTLLVVIAAVFIGGTSIFGGAGSIVGSYIGVLIVTVLQVGMVASGLGGEFADMVIGLVFIAAVILHMVVERPDRLKGLGLGRG